MTDLTEYLGRYRAALRTHSLGQAMEVYEELDSTNSFLKRRIAADDAPAGLAAAALSQTAGRGRRGHVWESAPGAGLYVSFLYGPVPGELLPLVPVAAGVAAVETVASLTGCAAGVKWPNDVIVHERKLAGILCEGSRGFAVCGIGVNLTQDEAFFAAAGLPHATSLRIEGAAQPDAARTAAELANRLEARLDALMEDGGASLLPDFRAKCVSLGREVRALSAEGEIAGVAVDIDSAGGLVIETAAGRRTVSAGEVQLRTARGYL